MEHVSIYFKTNKTVQSCSWTKFQTIRGADRKTENV